MVDAVYFEPVSAAKFPANREKNREFGQARIIQSEFDTATLRSSEACRQIPQAKEQGLTCRNRKRVSLEQGFEPTASMRRPPYSE
jgi:hypothetical protein